MQAVLARAIAATLSLAAVSAAAATGVRYVGARDGSETRANHATASTAPFRPSTSAPAPRAIFTSIQQSEPVRSFYFARAAYSDGRGFGGFGGRGESGGCGRGGNHYAGGTAFTDWDSADRVIVTVLRRLTNVDVQTRPFCVTLDDPDLSRFPFLYMVEPGRGLNLRRDEIAALRKYLLSGGFLVVDDFWGRYEWENFEYNIKEVLPEYEIRPITIDHPIFHTVYDVRELIQVPNVGNAERGGPTYECVPCPAELYGIFDDNDRMMVIINFNTDLGDAWEWAEAPYYPLQYSTYAYQMGANFIVYAMTR